MTPAEIARIFDWYSADLPNFWSTFCQDLKDKPSSLSDAFILTDRIITQTFAKSSTFY